MELGSTEIGYAACRIIAGILFFAQAYDKIFGLGVKDVTASFAQSLRTLPRGFIYFSVVANSYLELLCGALLVIGLLTTPALWLLSLNMVLVCLGFSRIKPLWDMQHFFPRLIFVLILLFLPESYNMISIDYLMGFVSE